MSSLVTFLNRLFQEGEIVFQQRPVPSEAEAGPATALLERLYVNHRLELAGPEIAFDAATALAAAELVRQAAWFLLNHTEPFQELENHVRMPAPPASAAQHLSADLLLRFLPQIHRRARAHAADDLLTRLLATILRQWPLSGVLSDVEEGPLPSLELISHPGLLLLYAERLARHEKPAWVPEGRPREYVELVYQELGRQLPIPVGLEKDERHE
jgi:hypothetical protein